MKKHFVFLLFFLLPFALGGRAQSVQLASLFSDHMVLQQNESVPIWGWARPGEMITIITSWGDSLKTRTPNTAQWKVLLNTPDAGFTSHTIQISGNSHSDIIFLRDVLIGEVWLASGQSNMEWTNRWLRVNDLESEIGKANLPHLRFFKVALRTAETPQDQVEGKWAVCTPDVMQNTSGTGYYFAKYLQDSLKCPVGVVIDSWGGTPIEFWYPKESFQDQPDLVESAKNLQGNVWWPATEPGWAYHAMTHPLGNYKIAGMLWYQGESNVFDPHTYAKKMAVLVQERRKQFGARIPVYFVQIAPYRYDPKGENSAWIRDQQRLSLEIWNTGMVVTSDIGDTSNIHPSNKRELGKRLARLALKNHYHQLDELVESPVYESAWLLDKQVYVSFNFSVGLHFKGPERGYFEVAEKDGNYVPVKAQVQDGKIVLDTRKIAHPFWVRFAFTNTATPVLFNAADLPASCFGPQKIQSAPRVHAVTDLAHEFTFYADHRFHMQYLPGQKGVTNWCNLYNFDFSNANLLILPGCDNRIGYGEKDLNCIQDFLKSGGGVVLFGSENSASQNDLLQKFGASFDGPAVPPFKLSEKLPQVQIEGAGGSVLSFADARKWEVLLSDSNQKPLLARQKIGKGSLLVSSRSLAGSHPSARDSINREIWKPLLIETAAGKKINPNKEFKTLGIEDLEYNDDHGTFKLSYNDYLKPFADAMVEVYKRAMPHVEKRMGVPLSPGMASQVTLLATGGGGFSSGTVVALAVWWGGFPDREDGMIEFLTHEAVHSWVLPFAEVWNEPIATYVGNLVMMDMGYEEEALRRIGKTIERASNLDPEMKNYDLQGNLTGEGRELNPGEKNNIHWGKSFWIFEELRKENPNIIADYFKLKREFARPDVLGSYGMKETVELLGKAAGRDLTGWFAEIGVFSNAE